MAASAHVVVRRVPVETVRPLRLAVLRPSRPAEAAEWAGDAESVHLAAYDPAGRVVGAVSVRQDTGQLRGMATDPAVRGQGYGAALLDAAVAAGATWCNARLTAEGFYARHGWRRVGEEFVTADTGLVHVRMERC